MVEYNNTKKQFNLKQFKLVKANNFKVLKSPLGIVFSILELFIIFKMSNF